MYCLGELGVKATGATFNSVRLYSNEAATHPQRVNSAAFAKLNVT